ncbi:MAG: Planctomycete cytochrome [Phycisphaerales bacterium]|nr:Planctomycete cytochrome [Phycisphaerales bacterium]
MIQISQQRLRIAVAWTLAWGAALCGWRALARAPGSGEVLARATSEKRAGLDWWALQPLKEIVVPQEGGAQWDKNGIDAFVLGRLKENHLEPSPAAGRREIARRLYFDLIGLPPTPAEMADYLGDEKPDAYARLVDRLLASPHYGERWARHWLDVARFGESDGFERDALRPNAWRYRDWVIAALNADMPYDEFARMQIAGDVLKPGDADGIIATGFLTAGAWDEVGQNQQSAAMKAVVRFDELEDLVGTTAQTFLGLTVNCARCHDHKFDPIPQAEYYRIASALAGVRHGDRDIGGATFAAESGRRVAAIEGRIDILSRQILAIEQPVRERLTRERAGRTPGKVVAAPEPIARWTFTADLRDGVASLHGTAHGDAKVSDAGLRLDGRGGYVLSSPLIKDLREKTLEAVVSLTDLRQRGGGVIGVQTLDGATFDSIVFGEREPGKWMAGSNGFVRTQPLRGEEEKQADTSPVHMAIVYASDGTITAYRNGARYGQPYKSAGLVTYKANEAQATFGIRHLPDGPGKLLGGTILRAALYDRALSAEEVARAAGLTTVPVTLAEVLAALPPQERAQRDVVVLEADHLRGQQDREKAAKAYAVVPGAPPVMHVLRRGNPAQEGETVTPGGIGAVTGAAADFGLPPDAPDSDRRARLAMWITDPHNPLFARVIVNRLWQYHFGVGLVETPNDFGFNGGRPSHPELLDWLAGELIRRKWSLKDMHRLIVTSATYRQSTRMNAAAFRADPGNRLLWRQSPRRLEAEALRDAMLATAGELNADVGGAAYQDFYTFTNNTTFYEPRDYVGESFNRRSVYRTWVRSGRSPLLDVFDCPDPSTRAPRRPVTTTPLQALSLMNDSFVLRMSDRLAERVAREAGPDVTRQIALAYELAFGRPATAEEIAEARRVAERDGMSAVCRVLFNSSEFVFVD